MVDTAKYCHHCAQGVAHDRAVVRRQLCNLPKTLVEKNGGNMRPVARSAIMTQNPRPRSP